MKPALTYLIATVSVTLAACATSTGVIPIGQDTYMLSASEKGPGYYSGAQVKAKAFTEATQYCASKGKQFQVVSTNQNDTRPFVFASAEVQFMCLDARDAELARPKLTQQADKTVEVRVQDATAQPKDKYSELLKLDELRKRGVITEAEFEAQKKAILAGK